MTKQRFHSTSPILHPARIAPSLLQLVSHIPTARIISPLSLVCFQTHLVVCLFFSQATHFNDMSSSSTMDPSLVFRGTELSRHDKWLCLHIKLGCANTVKARWVSTGKSLYTLFLLCYLVFFFNAAAATKFFCAFVCFVSTCSFLCLFGVRQYVCVARIFTVPYEIYKTLIVSS